jgi:4-amino-4-deoxy-L-arabinose transferase-like glycosyltransferase
MPDRSLASGASNARVQRRRIAALLATRWRGATVLAAGVGFAARLAFGFGYWVDKPLTHDELEYLTLARHLAAGNGFTYDAAPSVEAGGIAPQQFGRAPGYPVFLALVSTLSPIDPTATATPAAVKVAQAILGAVSVVVIAALAVQVGGPGAGTVAAAITTFHLPLVWISAYVLSEALYSPLALLSALILGRVTDQRGERMATGRASRVLFTAGTAGLVAGLSALTRPVLLLFLGCATIWLVFRPARRAAGAFVIGASLVIAPWTIRNAYEYQRIVLIAPQSGVNFWIGNHAFARGDGDLAANAPLKTADLELRERYPDLDAAELEPIYFAEAFGHIARHPLRWVGLEARKFFYQWVPIGPSYRLHSARYYAASAASYVMILPLAITGFVTLARRHRLPGALLVLAGSEVTAGLIFFPQERYRIPVIDPTLVILAATWIWLRFGTTEAPRRPGP